MATRADTLNEKWATDISLDPFTDGEIYNEDVINQSIEVILNTLLGKRLFNLTFGSNFVRRLFDSMDSSFSERLIDDTIKAIRRWDNRLNIIESEVSLTIDFDNNKALIVIPYIIPRIGKKAYFKRKIVE